MKFVQVLALSFALITLSSGSTSFAQVAKSKVVTANAQLIGSLNTKNAKAGEPVKAKLTSEVKLADGTTLARNTVLTGKIDNVTTPKTGDVAKLTLTFDRAEIKGGKAIPVKIMIVRLSTEYNPAASIAAPLSVGPTAIPATAVVKVLPGSKGSFGLESDMTAAVSGTVTRSDENVVLGHGTDMLIGITSAGE
jgi:hypothetical protein